MNDLTDFVAHMQRLIDAAALLDDILQYYDIYGECFDNERLLKGERWKDQNMQFYKEKLNQRIRIYTNFDDSE